jgi:ABC-2 type transport system ATP-binding protein
MVEVADPNRLGARALHRVRVRFAKPVDSRKIAKAKGVTVLSADNGAELYLQVEGEMDGLIKALAEYSVSDFETERPSLEEIFLTYYKNGSS